jgi:uncharacterized alpha-E superfamily protein
MLLCRLAENAYWLGRYMERAEDLARAILAYEEIRLDMPGQRAPGWQRLAALAGLAPEDAADLEPSAFISRVILDRGNSSSLLGAVHAARENLRRARTLFPSDCWTTINPLYLRLGALDPLGPPAELRRALTEVVSSCREHAGHVVAGMLRDDGHAFLRVGILLERLDMMLRVATIVAETLVPDQGKPFEDVRWIGLLKSVGAYGTYRHRYHAATSFKRALELLLLEPTFPRSLAYGLQEIGRDLARLPDSAEALSALAACHPTRAIETRAAFMTFAEEELSRLADLGSVIADSYFSLALPRVARRRAPSAARLQDQLGE